jgi:hypothetical protein
LSYIVPQITVYEEMVSTTEFRKDFTDNRILLQLDPKPPQTMPSRVVDFKTILGRNQLSL